MNEERVRFYNDLLKYGLGLEVLRGISGRVLEVTPYCSDCFQIATSKGAFLLWIHQGREESLVDQIHLIRHCKQRGFEGFLELLSLKTGTDYGKLDDRRWFYLTRRPSMENFFYSNPEHLRSAVRLIVSFRRSSSNWPLPDYWQGNEAHPDLLARLTDLGKFLEAFSMLAKHRIEPTRFDKMFMEYLPFLMECVAGAKELLSGKRINRLATGIVLNDLSRSNLRVGSSGQLTCLRVKHLSCEPLIMDLALLMVKSGRSNGWSRQWCEDLHTEYQKFFALSGGEMEFIKAYLTFPWGIVRLVSRYYLNRVEWPLHVFIGKMERLLNNEPKRLELIRALE